MLQKLEKILFKKRTAKEILFIFLGLLIFNFFYLTLLTLTFLFFLPDSLPKADILGDEMDKILKLYGKTGVVILVFFSALIEELLFRTPLILLLWKKRPFKIVLSGIIFLSLIFASLHLGNSTDHKFLFVTLMQGGWGILVSLLFIISGGNTRNFLKAFLITFLFHFAWNMILFSSMF